MDYFRAKRASPLRKSVTAHIRNPQPIPVRAVMALIAVPEITRQLCKHQLHVEWLEGFNPLEEGLSGAVAQGFHNATAILQKHRTVLTDAVRERCLLELAALVNVFAHGSNR